MYFRINAKNNRMIDYQNEPYLDNSDAIECDHFAPNDFIYPAWDVNSSDWVESATTEELSAMNEEQVSAQPDVTKDINTKLDKILNLLEKKEE